MEMEVVLTRKSDENPRSPELIVTGVTYIKKCINPMFITKLKNLLSS